MKKRLWNTPVAWLILIVVPLITAFPLIPTSPLLPTMGMGTGTGMWPAQNHLLTLDPRPKLVLKGKHGGRRVLELRAVPLPGTGYLHVDLNGILPQLISRSVGLDRDNHTGSEDDEDDKGGEEPQEERRANKRGRVMSEAGARMGGDFSATKETEAGDGRGKPSLAVATNHSAYPKGLPQLLCLPLSSPLLQSATRQLAHIRPYSVTRYMTKPEQEVVICYRQNDLRAVGCIL